MEPSTNFLTAYLPLLAPLIVIQLALVVAGLWDLSRRAATRGPKWLWAVVILFIQIFGPLAYFVVGRAEE